MSKRRSGRASTRAWRRTLAEIKAGRLRVKTKKRGARDE